MRKRYPSDLTDEQWAILQPLIPPAKHGGRPRKVDMREVLHTLFYQARTTVQWGYLPHDLLPKSTVGDYFVAWQTDGTWQKRVDALRGQVRRAEGRHETPSAACIDTQSVKTSEVGGPAGYDGNKKVKGRKRHIVVDTLGLLMAVAVTTADLDDGTHAPRVLAKLRGERGGNRERELTSTSPQVQTTDGPGSSQGRKNGDFLLPPVRAPDLAVPGGGEPVRNRLPPAVPVAGETPSREWCRPFRRGGRMSGSDVRRGRGIPRPAPPRAQAMAEPRNEVNPVDELAEEFARRWRAGERPSVEDYARQYPQWADEIREILPAVMMMEELKPRREDAGPSALVPPAPPDRQPEKVGEYRIVREIGRGGMGVVYEAEEETLGRRVALKVMPGHLLANDKLRSRFRRESQAAARLHHTNIVPVFAVGERDGLCFYAMQLIRGKGLDRIIGEAAAGKAAGTDGADAARPGKPLVLAGQPPREFCRAIALIGAQVADALAYAHTQGVLHRDVKPSNLLLDERGAVWVTDFGVAKLVEEANLTQSGDLVGTLKYMPPERFAGQSDARGDVYSLGVTLYELLTLRPAFPDTTPHHLIHLITHEAPARPRKVNPDVPPDLETIVLKAVARDPAQRYQAAGEMAEDLRRFLDDRPIVARRAGRAECAWRWCRRNPALAGTTVAAFLLMVAVTVVSAVGYARTAAANRETAAALASEKAQREQAENTATLALAALNRTYERFAPTRLVATPQAAGAEGVELPPQPALPPEAVPLLEDLLRTYEQIARSAGEFPRLRPRAAEANHRIGDLRQRLGRFEDAAAAYRTAIDLYAGLPPESAGDAVRIKLARACNELGRTLRWLQQPDEAAALHERAVRTLAEAPRAFADRPEWRYELARSYCTLGQRNMLNAPHVLGNDRPHRPGEPGHRPHGPPPNGDHPAARAAAILEQLVHDFPAVPEYRHLLACCYRDMPPGGPGRGPPGTNPNADRAVDLLRQLVADFPRVPDYRLDLCETLGRPGPPARPGEPSPGPRVKEAIALSDELRTHYPNVPEYAAAGARFLDTYGLVLGREGDLAGAEEQHRRAVELQGKLVRQYPEVATYGCWLSLMERSLGRVLGQRGQWKEARSRLESAAGRLEILARKESRPGPVRPLLGSVYQDLALVLAGSGEPALAAEVRRKAEQYRPEGGPGPFPHHDRPPPRVPPGGP